MKIAEALKIYKDDKTINIYEIAGDLEIDNSLLYKYANEKRKPSGIGKFGLATYLYLKYNIETDELQPYKALFDKQSN